MADRIPGISQLKSGVQWTCGDEEGAKQTQINFLKQWLTEPLIRSVECNVQPWVLKNLARCVYGDKDQVTEAMTDTVFHILGVTGAIGRVAGGPLWAIAGRVAIDLTKTLIMSAIRGEYKPSGIIKTVSNIKKDPKNVGNWFSAVFTVISTCNWRAWF